MVYEQLLPAQREGFDRAGELKQAPILPRSILDSDLHPTNDLPVNISKVLEIYEITVDVKVQITAIFTEKNGETIHRNTEVEVEIGIVDQGLQAGTTCCTGVEETNEAIDRHGSVTPYKLLNIEVNMRVVELVSNSVLCTQLQRFEISASQPDIGGCERRRLRQIWQTWYV